MNLAWGCAAQQLEICVLDRTLFRVGNQTGDVFYLLMCLAGMMEGKQIGLFALVGFQKGKAPTM
jgi:hypothetical protein